MIIMQSHAIHFYTILFRLFTSLPSASCHSCHERVVRVRAAQRSDVAASAWAKEGTSSAPFLHQDVFSAGAAVQGELARATSAVSGGDQCYLGSV